MEQPDSEKLDASSADGDEEIDGPPWKPTRAGPGTIIVLIAVSAVLCILFLMFILRVF